jgi:hypothetical protein
MIRRLAWMLVMLLAACTATSRPPVAAAPQSAPAAVPAPATSAGPAAPEQKAPECFVIQAANEREGLAAEGKWLHDHYAGWKKTGQSLVFGAEGKSFDYVDIVGSSGEKHSVCFDITSFFGKF